LSRRKYFQFFVFLREFADFFLRPSRKKSARGASKTKKHGRQPLVLAAMPFFSYL
jgi:hypothetical protein